MPIIKNLVEWLMNQNKEEEDVPLPPIPQFNGNWAMQHYPDGGEVETGPDTHAVFYVANQERFHVADRPFLAIKDNLAIAGMDFHHVDASTGKPCSVDIPFLSDKEEVEARKREVWFVATIKPLTVSPSIVCTDCGLHGFLRFDVWDDLAKRPPAAKPKRKPEVIKSSDPRYFE